MTGIAQQAARRFEERMNLHLRQLFPDQCRELGDDGVWDVIVAGQHRAMEYGLDSERDCAGFIDAMFLLGPSFDTDTDIPWAKSTLREGEPGGKVERLYCRMRRHFRQLTG